MIIKTGADYIVNPGNLPTRRTQYGHEVYDATLHEDVTVVGKPDGSTQIGDYYWVKPNCTVTVQLVNPSGTRDGAHFAVLSGRENISLGKTK